MVRSPAAIRRDRGVDAGRSLPACEAAAGLFPRSLASRQLLSRGTTDLQVVRAFLAGPMTFLIVNAMTIVAGGAILVSWRWMLALVALATVAPLLFLCARFEARYGSASRQAQDQAGDLTTAVEESVLGIRVIKGFGQQRSRALLFTEQARRLRGTELRKARLLAALSVFITTLPQLAAGCHPDPGRRGSRRPSPVSRNPAGLRRPAARAASLGGVSRIAAGHDQGDGDGGQPVLLGHGRASHHRGERRAAPRADSFPRRGTRLRGRAVPLPGRPAWITAGAPGREPADHRRGDPRARRGHRERQDHARRPGVPAVRADRGPDHPRRD